MVDVSGNRKILLCPSSYFPHWGGVEELTKNLAENLKCRGYEPVIATNRHPINLPQFEIMDGIPVYRFDFIYPAKSLDLPLRVARGLSAFIQYKRFVTELAPAVMHIICAGPTAFYTWLLGKPNEMRTVVSFCGELFMDSAQIYQRSKFYSWALNRLLEHTDAVSAVSQFVMDDANQRLDLSTIPQSILYPAIQINNYELPVFSSEGFPYAGRFVLGVGRFVENKGFEELIRAFEQIVSIESDLSLVIAGRGPLYAHYLEICAKLSLSNRVIILNDVDRNLVLNLYDRCEFFVIPSPSEPFALATLEAMRAEKSVIATTGGGTSEIIVHGVNGLLYQSGSVTDLADNMRRMLLNDQDRHVMAVNAKRAVIAFDWQNRIAQYLKFYNC